MPQLQIQENINRARRNTLQQVRIYSQGEKAMSEKRTSSSNFIVKREAAIARIKERANQKPRITNPNWHDKILLEIVSEKEHIKSGDLYREYKRRSIGRPFYMERNYRVRMKKLVDARCIIATGINGDRGYSLKEKDN